MIDTGLMRWARTDGDSDKSEILEFGKLIFVGMQGVLRIFAFEGRTVSTEGPGAGLCTFGYAMIDLDTTLTFYIQANVPIKDIISRRPIETVRYELIPVPGADNGTQEEREGPSREEKLTEQGSVPEGPAEDKQPTSETDIQSHD
jgi:hypothetical protein